MEDELEIDLDFGRLDRVVLNESEEGQAVAAEYVAAFGEFVREQLRPRLRAIAADGGEPQLLVNGLAELMRQVADTIEFPVSAPR
jgi:hypothetical protein